MVENFETKVAETEKITLVIFGGFLGTAALDFEMFDKIADKLRHGGLGMHKNIIAWLLWGGGLIIDMVR